MTDFNSPPQSGSGNGTTRPFPRIKEFVSTYANGTGDDKRSAQTYCDCESDEAVEALRRELTAVAHGNFNADAFDLTVGKARVAKYGSYNQWAKLCLQWIAHSRKR
jgi:hypothetical protein